MTVRVRVFRPAERQFAHLFWKAVPLSPAVLRSFLWSSPSPQERETAVPSSSVVYQNRSWDTAASYRSRRFSVYSRVSGSNTGTPSLIVWPASRTDFGSVSEVPMETVSPVSSAASAAVPS